MTTFNKLYSHYKNCFDLEMRLKNSNTTYEESYKKIEREKEWF